MTQKSLKISINENYFQPLKKNFATNNTDVYHIDDVWSLDILDSKDYGPENNRGYRYVLVIIDNFSKFGWTVPLKKTCSNKKRLVQNFFDIFKKKTKFNRNKSRKRSF